MFKDPFDPKALLGRRGCSCGGNHAQADHARLTAEAVPAGEEDRWNRVVDAAVLRAVFPVDAQRRQFLKTVGAATAMAAISSVLPLGAAREAFAPGAGAPEKKDLKVGFIPITCATPIIMAHPMGFYSKQGLNVEVVKTAGWAVIRDKSLAKEYDASHMLSPMPIAISLGVGSNPVPWTMPAIENINGQADHPGHQAQGQAQPEGLEGLPLRRAVRLFDAQLPAALLRGGARARSRQGHLDPLGAAAGDGGQPARRQYRRLSRPRSVQPARRVRRHRLHPPADQGDCGTAIPAAPSRSARNSPPRIRTPTARC